MRIKTLKEIVVDGRRVFVEAKEVKEIPNEDIPLELPKILPLEEIKKINSAE